MQNRRNQLNMTAMEIDNETDVTITLMIINTGKDDEFQSLNLPNTTALSDLKVIIQEQYNIPAKSQALYYKNLYLKDDTKTLKDLSFQTNDVMMLRTKIEESKDNNSSNTSNTNTNSNTNNNNTDNNNNNNNNSNSNSNTNTAQSQTKSNNNSNNNSNNSNDNNNNNGSNVVGGINLGMPLFGPNAPLPQMPGFLRMDPFTLQQQLRSDEATLGQLLHNNPTLAEAVLSDDITLLQSYLHQKRMEFQEKLQKEQQRRAAIMSDPLNPEYQSLIAQEIQQENINQNYETAIEQMPEAFGQVVMLYVPMEVEGHKVNAFIDSGAQSTIMSKDMAERVGIMRLVDRRFHGIAKGVGTAKIVGRIHIVKIKFGNIFLPTSLTILDDPSMEFLFGLDMLRRHRACIDLDKGCLRIHEQEVNFLQEKDIPHLRQRNQMGAMATAQQQQEALEQQQLQDATMASLANNNNNSNANNNSNNDTAVTTGGSGNNSNNNNANSNASNANSNNNGNNGNNNNGNFDLMGTLLGALGGNPAAASASAASGVASGASGGGGYGAVRSTQQRQNNGNRNRNSNVSESEIQNLMNLGFTRDQVMQALTATNGNAEMAASLLFQMFGGGLGF